MEDFFKKQLKILKNKREKLQKQREELIYRHSQIIETNENIEEDESIKCDYYSLIDELSLTTNTLTLIDSKINLLTNKINFSTIKSGIKLILVSTTNTTKLPICLTDNSNLVDINVHIYSIYSEIGKILSGHKDQDIIDFKTCKYQICFI